MRDISNNRVRHILLTHTLLHRPRLLILSRPIRNISITNRTRLCDLVAHLHSHRNYNILVISRSLRLIVDAASRIIYLGHRIYYSKRPRRIDDSPTFIRLFNGGTRDLTVCRRRRSRTRSLRNSIITTTPSTRPRIRKSNYGRN